VSANKEIIRAMEDALNRRDWPAYEAQFADSIRWSRFPAGRDVRRAAYVSLIKDIVDTFPDWTVIVERLIAEDDWVAERSRFKGTHLAVAKISHHGDLRGVAPTGKTFEVWQSHYWRIRDGLIVEHEAVRDDLGIFRQLGLIA
jgi:steroid delta-isomerase-like uncharacterized protein